MIENPDHYTRLIGDATLYMMLAVLTLMITAKIFNKTFSSFCLLFFFVLCEIVALTTASQFILTEKLISTQEISAEAEIYIHALNLAGVIVFGALGANLLSTWFTSNSNRII